MRAESVAAMVRSGGERESYIICSVSFVLPVAFFLSGVASLIFQVVWMYRCGLVFGSSVAAATVVLSSFMGGLALGNALGARVDRRRTDLLRIYSILEVIVALVGVLATWVLPQLSMVLVPLTRVAGDTALLVNIVRFVLSAAVLAVPATAMGATLPLLVAARCEAGERFGSALGMLYGWNTLGAVVGAVASEVLLVRVVGIAGSAVVAASLNLCAAGLVIAFGKGLPSSSHGSIDGAGERVARQQRPLDGESRSRRVHVWRLLLATTLCGAQLLALEVVWFRFLSMYVLVTTLAMSLMLAVVLAGIGLGGLSAAAWLHRSATASAGLPVVSALSGIAVVAGYALFQWTSGTQVEEWWRVLWFASVLALPVSVLSGVLFTLVGAAVDQQLSRATASAGWVACANTLGAMSGPPVAAYLLLPRIGMEGSFFALASAYGVVAILTIPAARRKPDPGPALVHRRTRAAAFAALLAALVAFPFGAMNGRYFARAAATYADDGSTIVATREGPSETLFVMRQQWLGQPVYSRLVTNGFSMSGTAILGQRYMRAFAYYPMLFHDGPLKRALVVCYGVGVTVGAVTHIPSVQSIDVAEISKDVVAMSDSIYPSGEGPLADPRVRVHIEDGRFFLETTSERFDLITGEPPPPRTPGTVNIYTRDYFQLVHDRLAEGGLATYWVPVARPRPGTDVNTIIHAFCDVFSDCTLWNATPFDLMLVGSRGASGTRTVEQFLAPWQTPVLETRLREVGFERAEQIGATFIADASHLRDLTAAARPLTDDFPQRLRPAPGRPSVSDPGYGVDPAVTRLYQTMLDTGRARKAFEASPFVRRLWPEPLIERTLPYFDVQAAINRVYWEGGNPLRQIGVLDAVLTGSTLRTLPLWMLGSDEVKQRIAEGSRDDSGAVEYAHALRAIIGRDYAGAARWLAAADARGLHAPTVRPLLGYALMRSGQTDAARRLAAVAHPSDDDARHFWSWIQARLS
jgi:spermidine synthase